MDEVGSYLLLTNSNLDIKLIPEHQKYMLGAQPFL